MKKKGVLIVAIILMSIGFAAISTTLVINGNAKVGENEEDFSVIFTAASIDGKDVYNTVIDDTKKTINFSTNELKTLNQTSILTYEVTNNSANYDANVTVTCVPKDGTTAKYTSIENVLEGNATVIKAKESLNGSLTITLDKTATEEVSEEYTCTITAKAVERDELGNKAPTTWVPTYFAFGTPTTSSVTDYKALSQKVFIGLDSIGTKGVCINDNGLFCLKPNDVDNSILLSKEHFGESFCLPDGTMLRCLSLDFHCNIDSDGYVECGDETSLSLDSCFIRADGWHYCGT